VIHFLLAVAILARAESFDAAEQHCDAASRAWLASGLTEEEVGGQTGLYEQCMRDATGSTIPLGDGSFWRQP
jgi:hypothetical protein